MNLAVASRVDAGIVTSMDSVGSSSLKVVTSQTGRVDDSHFRLAFKLLVEISTGLNHALPNSTSTTGGSTSPGFGPTQMLASCAIVIGAQELPARGWTVPQETLALPPLLPSGLFRPPRSFAV
jgi:hypothetical protein